MFKQLKLPPTEQQKTVVIHVDKREVIAYAGQTLAASLLAAGVTPFRQTAVSGAPRSPLCLMGVCFECLVAVDGAQNVQSCMVEVRDGMRVQLLNGARAVEPPT